ncbi:hypothetical protein BDV32DRAFT_117281, partial [Aspergillus pseudonomiae]
MGNGTTGKRKTDEREGETVLTSLSLCGVFSMFYYFFSLSLFFLFLFSLLVGGCLNVLISKRKLIEQKVKLLTSNPSSKLPCFFFY